MQLFVVGSEKSRHQVVQRASGKSIHQACWPCSRAIAVFVLVLSWLALQGITTAQGKPVRRILILNETGTSYPAIALINQGIQTALYNSPYRLEFYSEYFDTLLFPDPATQQEFRAFYIRKYRNRRPDVIITVGPSPIKFMDEVHQKAFPGVPIVFCLPIGSVPAAALNSESTGVEHDIAPAKTVEVALRLQPGTKHLVVVGGASDFDKHHLVAVDQKLKPFRDQVDISYMTNLAMPDLLENLRHLPSHTIVLFTSVGRDAAGTPFKANEAGPLIADAANAPVFSLFDANLNHGEVGGYVSSLSQQGDIAGHMALRLLNGERPQDIPRVKGVHTYMFDARALKRWRLKEQNLPPGSMVLNRQLTVWESYKWYIIGGVALIIGETLLVFGLAWQRARRRKAETAVRESEERFRLVANSAPVLIWMAGLDKQCTYVNQPWLKFTGRSLDAELGNGWTEGIHPEDLKSSLDTYTSAFDSHESFEMQYRLRRSDGEYRWIFDVGVPRFNADGSFAGYIGSSLDVTEQKMIEEALTRLSGRLIEGQEEERKRIARELHDDYNQRLAMLAIDLEKLADTFGDSSIEAAQQVHKLFNHVSELGADLHSLSHTLHSSTLESLGLVAGVRAFCHEFAEQQRIQVDFAHENIPRDVPSDAALCMFRIAQEGLRNIKKHSGASRAEVRLECVGEELHLWVQDTGKGFEVNGAPMNGGIGIRSMKERLRVFGGHLEIESRPLGGTRLDAWLPFKITRQRAS